MTTIPAFIALLASLDDSMINEATIDAYATILIALVDADPNFSTDDATAILTASSDSTLNAELLDTLRDNTDDIDLSSF